MAYKVEYIPKELAALQVEISKHPDLIEKGKECENFSQCIGMIAAEVDIALDGMYTEDDMRNLYVILKNKLERRRSPILLLSDLNGGK